MDQLLKHARNRSRYRNHGSRSAPRRSPGRDRLCRDPQSHADRAGLSPPHQSANATCRRRPSPCTASPASSLPPSRCFTRWSTSFSTSSAMRRSSSTTPRSTSASSMPSSTVSSGQPIPRDRLVDTLLLARRKHPGVSNRLDDLCSRYAIDNSRRTKHGALLDAELLAEVYIDLIGARQSQLVLASESQTIRDRRRRRHAAPAARRSRLRRGSPMPTARPIGPLSPRSARSRSGRIFWPRRDHEPGRVRPASVSPRNPACGDDWRAHPAGSAAGWHAGSSVRCQLGAS